MLGTSSWFVREDFLANAGLSPVGNPRPLSDPR
jgi:hypothetical protein